VHGDYDLVGAEAEVRLFGLNLLVEFGEVEEVDLALLIDHPQLHALLLELDVKHLLRDHCLCSTRPLELVDLDVNPIDSVQCRQRLLDLGFLVKPGVLGDLLCRPLFWGLHRCLLSHAQLDWVTTVDKASALKDLGPLCLKFSWSMSVVILNTK
jgi:hypothetical protein